MSKVYGEPLTEDELREVSGGVVINNASFTSISVSLEAGETAKVALANLELPFGLKLDESSKKLLAFIATTMDNEGKRNLKAAISVNLSKFLVSIISYSLS